MPSIYSRGTSKDQPAPGDARYIAYDAPEPGPWVTSVTIIEDEPELRRWDRIPRGWRVAGAVNRLDGIADARCVVPWEDVGRCWAGTQHALKDVTNWPMRGCGCGCSNCTGPGCGCCSNC